MSDAIIKVLNELCDKFGIAIDWTSDNVVPYLQDLMVRYSKYVCYTSIMWLVIGLILSVSSTPSGLINFIFVISVPSSLM